MRTGLPTLLTITAALLLTPLWTTTAQAHPRHPLRVDVPSQPKLPNSTQPILYTCADIEDCNAQAQEFCAEFEYPKGRVLFKTLPAGVRPFPIYSVICFGE